MIKPNVFEKFLVAGLLPAALVLLVAPPLISAADDALVALGFALVVLWIVYTVRVTLAWLTGRHKAVAQPKEKTP